MLTSGEPSDGFDRQLMSLTRGTRSGLGRALIDIVREGLQAAIIVDGSHPVRSGHSSPDPRSIRPGS